MLQYIHNSKTGFSCTCICGQEEWLLIQVRFHWHFLITLKTARGNSSMGFMAVWKSDKCFSRVEKASYPQDCPMNR